jgi:hypothetical protein
MLNIMVFAHILIETPEIMSIKGGLNNQNNNPCKRPENSPVGIPVAARSKAYVCGLLVAVIAGSNSARGMDVYRLCLYVVLSCVGSRGLCDGLITGPEESYRVSVRV